MSGKYVAYHEYKDSGVGFLNKLPVSWGIKKVNYLFSFGRGLNITKANLEDCGVPVVNYGEVHSKFGFEINPDIHNLKRVSEDYLKTTPAALLQNGDFVFADTSEDLDGAGNFTQFVGNGLLFAGYHTVVLRPNDGNVSRYLAYAFESTECRNQIRLAVKGVKVFSITQSILKDAMLPMPPPEEQITIAAFLDYETARIDQLIAKQQRLIELLKEKRQAVISHAVTKGLNPDAPMKDSGVEWLGQVPEHWRIRRLKQVIECGTSISYGIVQPGDALDEGVPFIQTTNISRGNLSFDDLPKTSALIEKNYPRSRLTGGEVILGIRASIGAAYVVPSELKGANLSRGVARIQTNEVLSSEFLVRFFQSNSVEQYWGLSKQGSTFSEVSIETVRELYVTIPSKNEQNEICSHLDLITNKFDSLITLAEQQNILLWERRTALISAAVTGKIDVRGWNASNERNSV